MPPLIRTTITCPGGSVEIAPLDPGKHRVEFHPANSTVFSPRLHVETTFPIGLLSALATTEGPGICEEIARHEEAGYVLGAIKRQVGAYFDELAFDKKRLMDFGCGSGASTFGLAARFPRTEVVGVELSEARLLTARRIAEYRQLENVSFAQSPNGSELPPGIGQFDYIMLSAVWEHLLPAERPAITKLLWNALKPGGALLINQTPYRWAPFEHHTTGLWGINYLPDQLACYMARHHARETPADLARCDWPQLLRRGIRGGTEWEVLRNIRRAGGNPALLQPLHGSRAGAWYRACGPRHRWAKWILAEAFGVCDALLGTMPVVHLEMVIRRAA